MSLCENFYNPQAHNKSHSRIIAPTFYMLRFEIFEIRFVEETMKKERHEKETEL